MAAADAGAGVAAGSNDRLTEPDSFDLTKYSNLFLSACENGHTDLLKFLFAKELFGKEAILRAMKKWFYSDLRGLIWSFVDINLDVNLTNFRGMCGLMLASKNGQVDIIKMLLQIPDLDFNIQDKSGMSSLLHATRRGKWKVVDLLLQQKDLNVNLRDESGWSSLMIASRKGKMVSEFLTREDIDINILDNDEAMSALILASKYGHTEAVEELLYDPNLHLSALMNSGDTQYEGALHYAYKKNHIEIISILELDDDSYIDEDEEHYI